MKVMLTKTKNEKREVYRGTRCTHSGMEGEMREITCRSSHASDKSVICYSKRLVSMIYFCTLSNIYALVSSDSDVSPNSTRLGDKL